jgi:hypothetical protein
LNSVWEDGEEKEAGEIILGLKKKKSPTIYRSFLTPSVIKTAQQKNKREERLASGHWSFLLGQ